jgi:hypothetical protein
LGWIDREVAPLIWSSRARNRSFDPVVLCFFGRIVPSDAPQNHGPEQRESTNELAWFGRWEKAAVLDESDIPNRQTS